MENDGDEDIEKEEEDVKKKKELEKDDEELNHVKEEGHKGKDKEENRVEEGIYFCTTTNYTYMYYNKSMSWGYSMSDTLISPLWGHNMTSAYDPGDPHVNDHTHNSLMASLHHTHIRRTSCYPRSRKYSSRKSLDVSFRLVELRSGKDCLSHASSAVVQKPCSLPAAHEQITGHSYHSRCPPPLFELGGQCGCVPSV